MITRTIGRYSDRSLSIMIFLAAAVWGLYWVPIRGLEQLGVMGPWSIAYFNACPILVLVPALFIWRRSLHINFTPAVFAGVILGIGLALYATGLVGYIGGARNPAVLPDPDLVDHYRDDLAVRAGHGAAYSGDSMRVIGMFFIAQDGPRLQRVDQRRRSVLTAVRRVLGGGRCQLKALARQPDVDHYLSATDGHHRCGAWTWAGII